MTLSAPILPVASRSASTLGSTKHVITSLSSLSRLKSSCSPALSSNSCFRGLTEAGSASATNLLTSIGEAGTFPPPVFWLLDDVSHSVFSTAVSAASSIPEAE